MYEYNKMIKVISMSNHFACSHHMYSSIRSASARKRPTCIAGYVRLIINVIMWLGRGCIVWNLRGPQLLRITSTALGIIWIHCSNRGIKWRFLNRESEFLRSFLHFSYKINMNHAIHKPLFGKQESQESIKESYIQAKGSPGMNGTYWK